MADQAEAAARKQATETRAEVDKRTKETMERMAKSKPTPTQEENDLAKLGVHVPDKEDDGSGPDPSTNLVQQRHSEAKPAGGGGYQTRHSTAEHRSTPKS
jgi:hypothetical protein